MSDCKFNLVEELSSNRREYDGTERLRLERGWLTTHAASSFDRVRARVDPKPTFATTVACCVAHGMQVIRSNDDIRRLLCLKEQIGEKLGAAHDDVEEIFGFQSFPLSAMGPDSKSPADKNIILLPKQIKKEVRDLASDLSASESVIVTLSSMVILSTQEAVVINDYCELMKRKVSAFFGKVSLRRQVAEAYLKYDA